MTDTPAPATNDPYQMLVARLKPYITAEVFSTHPELATDSQKTEINRRAEWLIGTMRDVFHNKQDDISKFIEDEIRACVGKRNAGEPVQFTHHLVEVLKPKVEERFCAANGGEPSSKALSLLKLDMLLDPPGPNPQTREERPVGFTGRV